MVPPPKGENHLSEPLSPNGRCVRAPCPLYFFFFSFFSFSLFFLTGSPPTEKLNSVSHSFFFFFCSSFLLFLPSSFLFLVLVLVLVLAVYIYLCHSSVFGIYGYDISCDTTITNREVYLTYIHTSPVYASC